MDEVVPHQRYDAVLPKLRVETNMNLTVENVRQIVTDVWRGARGMNRERLFMLGALTLGHIIVHWYQQIFSLVIPSIKRDLGLTNVQVGALSTARQITNGLNLPSGYIADSYRSWTNAILAAAILSFGLGYYLMGVASSYEWALGAAALIGLGAVLWHPAALGSLSLQFKERRGLALSIHGAGASIGDSIAPIIVGAILLSVNWRLAMQTHLLPALLVAFGLWWGLRHVFGGGGERPTFGSYLAGIREMVTNIQVVGVVMSNSISGMSRLAVTTFFPIYVTETLGYSAFILGIYLALLYVMGLISQPIMGILSDQHGRKAVLVPAFSAMTVLFVLMVIAPGGVALGLVVAALGCFFYGTANVTASAVMDVAPENVQAGSFAISSLISQPFNLVSPIVSGILVENFGLSAAFWYAAALQAVSTVVLIPIHFRRTPR